MKLPSLSTVISHHMEVVMKLSERRAHWRYYDEHFRRMLERGEAKWGSTHLELYLRSVLDSMGDRATISTATLPSPLSKLNPPRGACFNHHKGLHCAAGLACKYQHNCFNCLEAHPFNKCTLPIQHPFKVLPKYAPKQARPDAVQPFRGGYKPTQSQGPTANSLQYSQQGKGVLRKQ
jgi:hypothetical protein